MHRHHWGLTIVPDANLDKRLAVHTYYCCRERMQFAEQWLVKMNRISGWKANEMLWAIHLNK